MSKFKEGDFVELIGGIGNGSQYYKGRLLVRKNENGHLFVRRSKDFDNDYLHSLYVTDDEFVLAKEVFESELV